MAHIIDTDALLESYMVDPCECPGCPEPEWLEELAMILDTAPEVDVPDHCEGCMEYEACHAGPGRTPRCYIPIEERYD